MPLQIFKAGFQALCQPVNTGNHISNRRRGRLDPQFKEVNSGQDWVGADQVAQKRGELCLCCERAKAIHPQPDRSGRHRSVADEVPSVDLNHNYLLLLRPSVCKSHIRASKHWRSKMGGEPKRCEMATLASSKDEACDQASESCLR